MSNYFLKCEHCGHLNEMKTSYLVFCGSCGKKMQNNFSNWQILNPGKSFESYQQEVCVSETQYQAIEADNPKPRKKISNKTWIGILIGISLVIIVGLGTSYVIKEFLFPNLEKYRDGKWTTQTCGTLGLSIDAPIKMKPSDLIENEIPEESKKYLLSMETYTSSVMNQKLMIMTNSVEYVPEINASLEGAVQGSLNEIKNKPGLSDFQQDVSPLRKGELQGALVTGKYKENNMIIGYRMAMFVKGNAMWQVFVAYDYKDKAGYEISERIINSVSITTDFAMTQPQFNLLATIN